MERESIELSGRYGMHIEEFSSLMARRVLDILLVASQYDAFVLEEDGQLTELVTEEYRSLDLNLRYAPRFIRASTGAEALAILAEREIDMLVTTPRLRDTSLKSFIEGVKAERPQLPVGLLAAHAWDLPWLEPIRQSGMADWIFLWQGSVKALLAMIKQVEDRQNADHDILEGGVQAIILVEDEVRFYSAYLPHIYTEVTTQTSRLMAEGLNLSHRLLRIRARPKILLAQTYEQAWDLYERYAGNVLGIISDASFPREGVQDAEAGLRLAQAVRNRNDDIPFLLQSMDTSLEARCRRGRGLVPGQGLADPARGSATFHPRELRLRRLRVPGPRRSTGGAGQGHPRNGAPPCRGTRRVPRPSRRSQPLLGLAEGANGVRAGLDAAAREQCRSSPLRPSCAPTSSTR